MYCPDDSEPGQLKAGCGVWAEDVDYWIAGLGPESYGADKLYECAIIMDS